MQELYEECCLGLIDAWLSDVLAETGHIVLAGGGALNVKLNQRILARPDVEALFVQPAAGDSGTALGAATQVAAEGGDRLARMEHVFLGPAFDSETCERAARQRAGVTCQQGDGRRRGDGRPARRGETGRVVPGTHGVRPPGARRAQHPRMPERHRDRRPHQRPDQVPRALASVLPVDPRPGGPGHHRHGSPGALHDRDLRRDGGVEADASPRWYTPTGLRAYRWSNAGGTRATTT